MMPRLLLIDNDESRAPITELSMSDSIAQGTIAAVSLEQVTSTGKHTPTVYINGRCRADHVIGCRFWLMIADNKKANDRGTPDVVSFLVFNSVGQRVAYGTGPVAEGDIQVAPTSNCSGKYEDRRRL